MYSKLERVKNVQLYAEIDKAKPVYWLMYVNKIEHNAKSAHVHVYFIAFR